MNNNFYRYWLPISIAVHVVIVAVLWLLKLPSVNAAVQDFIPVAVLETPQPIPPTHPVKVELPRETTASVQTSLGNPKSTRPTGTGTSLVRDPQPGPGKRPAKAPKLLTSANGTWDAPEGDVDGMGTTSQGETGVPSGPSYGAAAHGVPNPRYPKIAQEEGYEGTVVVTVHVSASGSVESVEVTQPCMYDSLNASAARAARDWRGYAPGMEHGKAVGGSVQLRFRYANGKVEGSIL